jgi:hypothetical protein
MLGLTAEAPMKPWIIFLSFFFVPSVLFAQDCVDLSGSYDMDHAGVFCTHVEQNACDSLKVIVGACPAPSDQDSDNVTMSYTLDNVRRKAGVAGGGDCTEFARLAVEGDSIHYWKDAYTRIGEECYALEGYYRLKGDALEDQGNGDGTTGAYDWVYQREKQ